MRENVERQCLFREFHLERRARHNVAQQRVGNGLAQKLVGRPREERRAENISVGARTETVLQAVANALEHSHIAVQIVALVRKLCGQSVGKMLIAIGKEIRLAANAHFVEGVVVKAVPRQAHQIEIAEDSIQRLTIVEPANIVEARVEFRLSAAESLQASTNHRVLFQHTHIQPLTSQNIGALQSAKSASDYRNIVFHLL